MVNISVNICPKMTPDTSKYAYLHSLPNGENRMSISFLIKFWQRFLSNGHKCKMSQRFLTRFLAAISLLGHGSSSDKRHRVGLARAQILSHLRAKSVEKNFCNGEISNLLDFVFGKLMPQKDVRRPKMEIFQKTFLLMWGSAL